MKRYVLAVIVFLVNFFMGCCDEPQKAVAQNLEQTTELSLKTIVALGDSLTAGFGVDLNRSYPAQLEKKLQANGYGYRVVNAGVSGETSSGTLSRLEWILTQAPDIVIVETGANDGLRGVSTDLLEDNLREIVTTLQKRNVAVLLAGMQMVWNLGPDYVASFNSVYPRVARDMGVVLMPFFLEDVATVSDLNQEDGIHPNGKGYAVIVENMYPHIIRIIESVTP